MSETVADRREYLESGLTDVDCGRCGACVHVRKYSTAQTSIQWTTEAQRRCTAFDLRAGCPDLRRDIDAAVMEGRLPVGEN